MARKPTPVIVISSHAAHNTVFRALELGAMDFMAKPGRQIGPELREIEGELIRKIRLVRRLQAVRLQRRAQSLARQRDARDTRELEALVDPEDELDGGAAAEDSSELGEGARRAPAEERRGLGEEGERVEPVSAPRHKPAPVPDGVVGIAASTGGPPAVQQILCGLSGELPLAVLVAQHMPARFTRAFASRLDKMCSMRVVEATEGMTLRPGVVYIAPGASNLAIDRDAKGLAQIRLRAQDPGTSAKIAPSGDMLLGSGGRLFQQRFCAVILTGMGTDGRDGAMLAREHGARVIVEDPHTAVMPGMPQAVIDAGVVDEVCALDDIVVAIQRFADRCASSRTSRREGLGADEGGVRVDAGAGLDGPGAADAEGRESGRA
jgi:two-component system chemotaxis response regulator CheB